MEGMQTNGVQDRKHASRHQNRALMTATSSRTRVERENKPRQNSRHVARYLWLLLLLLPWRAAASSALCGRRSTSGRACVGTATAAAGAENGDGGPPPPTVALELCKRRNR